MKTTRQPTMMVRRHIELPDSDRLPSRLRLGAAGGLALLFAGTAVVAARAGNGDPALFSISVDGEQVAGTASAAPASGLDAVDVQVKYDGLAVTPFLNVSTNPPRAAWQPGEAVTFRTSSNYGAWIDHAEIRILADDARPGDKPEIVVAPADGEAHWTMPADGPDRFTYVLRVYDADGRFDETAPLPLERTLRATGETEKAPAPGYGEDRAAIRNIALTGGTITVAGREVPPGTSVTVLGKDVPVDEDGRFVTQTVLPAGDHEVDVTLAGAAGKATFSRAVNIPRNDWFYVALADLTIGRRTGDAGIEAVRPGEFPGVYKKGRLAFYLKGKIKGKYLLTAAADTGEGELKSLFKGFDGKDARSILRRLDPNQFYPIYGDGSTVVDDAPTNGKFYLRVDRGDSHVMWGTYHTAIEGTEFLRQGRTLYGASAVYRSEKTTSFGARRAEVEAYAAQPGTLPQRDIFRGTGGSVYFLKHRDITVGSDRITVEVVDPVTGQVVERRTLTRGTDYEIDTLQGVVMLRRPLASSTGDSGAVTGGAPGGRRLDLVVQYEYTPVAGEIDGYVYGGRAQAWLGEHVRVGATGMSEKTGTADQIAYGADIVLRKSDRTFVEAEYAQSRGPGFGSSYSTDGGLSSSDSLSSGLAGLTANAWRVRAQVGLEEVTGGRVEGTVAGYYARRKKGFSTLSENVAVDATIWGISGTVNLADNVALALTYDDFADANGKAKRVGEASVTYTINDHWTTIVGIEHTMLADPTAIKSGLNGERTDIGVRLVNTVDEDHRYYAFAQATAARAGDIRRNDRVGVGAELKLTERIGVSGEVSYGTTGIGALAAVNYDPTPDSHYYVGYRLDPDRLIDPSAGYVGSGVDGGVLVGGIKRKLNDDFSAYTETQYDLFGRKRSLTQAYGVVYTPDALWTIDGSMEFGRIDDSSIDPGTGFERADFDRKAAALTVGYSDEERGLAARLRGEVRVERSDDHSRDLNGFVGAADLSWAQTEDWRLQTSLKAVVSDKLTTSVLDGTYIEGSIGYAYRPVANDRFNALFRYTYLYDLPGPDQVNAGGDLNGPAQRSHILSADAIYDVNGWLSVGAKYGMRIGDQRARGATDWTRADAHLAILRADFHVMRQWDALAEARALWSPSADTVDYGALIALYRHVGDNLKVGVGYNFGRFSDDLRDLTLDDQGVFLNVVGKF